MTLGIIVSELYSRSALRTIEERPVSAALRAWKAEAGRGGWRVEYIESADAEAKPPTKNLDLAWIIVRQLGGVVSEVGNGLRVVVELAPGEVGERGAEKRTPPAESERRPEEIRTAPALRSSPPIGDAIFAQEEMAAVRTLRDQAADKELESFFYAVTHDLRAPLRAIGGFATILAEEEGARLSAEGQRILGAITGQRLADGKPDRGPLDLRPAGQGRDRSEWPSTWPPSPSRPSRSRSPRDHGGGSTSRCPQCRVPTATRACSGRYGPT